MRLSEIRKILVIRRRGLGDALVSLPAVEALARALSAASIDLVIDRPFAPLIGKLTDAARIITWPPSSGRGWFGPLRAAGYDLVLDFPGSPRTALWTVMSGAPMRLGYALGARSVAYNLRVPRNRSGPTRTAAFAGEAFLDPLRKLGLELPPWRPRARTVRLIDGDLGQAYRRWAENFFADGAFRVGIMLSATWPAKAWPASQGAELGRLLRQLGLRPLFIPGPGDEIVTEALKREDASLEFAPPTTLLELAHLLEGLDLFAGTDCGARHLAACLGKPTVTVFGPTNPRGWSISDPRHIAVTHDCDCSPCDLKVCPIAGHPCLDALEARDVVAAAMHLLPAGGTEG